MSKAGRALRKADEIADQWSGSLPKRRSELHLCGFGSDYGPGWLAIWQLVCSCDHNGRMSPGSVLTRRRLIDLTWQSSLGLTLGGLWRAREAAAETVAAPTPL